MLLLLRHVVLATHRRLERTLQVVGLLKRKDVCAGLISQGSLTRTTAGSFKDAALVDGALVRLTRGVAEKRLLRLVVALGIQRFTLRRPVVFKNAVVPSVQFLRSLKRFGDLCHDLCRQRIPDQLACRCESAGLKLIIVVQFGLHRGELREVRCICRLAPVEKLALKRARLCIQHCGGLLPRG